MYCHFCVTYFLVGIHLLLCFFFFFFFNDPATTEIYTLSLHDALPIWKIPQVCQIQSRRRSCNGPGGTLRRSEEHTSELQSRFDLVCRLLLEKKKKKKNIKNKSKADQQNYYQM